MNETALYYKLKVEMEQELKRRLTEDKISTVDWMDENGCNEKCGRHSR